MRGAFGGGASDFAWRSSGGNVTLPVGAVAVSMWTAQTGGTQITDLLNAAGSAVSTITSNADGSIPQFSGPDDGTQLMWADAGGSERVRLIAYGAYAPLALSPSLAQGANVPSPTDQSTVIQAAINSAFTAGGGTVLLPRGWFYGSFQMRPNVDVRGAGKGATVLAAMPGQTAAVVDYATYNAYHTVLRDVRVDGNYRPGRTDGVTQGACRGINMDTTPTAQTNFVFNNINFTATLASDAAPPVPFGATQTSWNDSANAVENVLVTNVGGDIALFLGGNQRGAWMHNVFVYACKAIAIQNDATDTQCTNVQAGVCGDGIIITRQNQQWTNCKSWWHKVTTGYVTGGGDGWRVALPDDSTYGAIRLMGCESQDCIGRGLAVVKSTGVYARGFISGGDSVAAVYLNDAQSCDIELMVQYADRTQDTVVVALDGAGGTLPAGNRVQWTTDLLQWGSSGLTPYTTSNGARKQDNKLTGPAELQHGIALVTAYTATLTPTTFKTQYAAAFTGATAVAAPAIEVTSAIASGDELIILIQDSAGGHAVTWAANYHGASGFTATAGAYSLFRFIYVGGTSYYLLSSQVNVA